MQQLDAIILAGGLGTRLRAVVPHAPKPLAPIGNTAFLDLLINRIEKSGIVKRIVLALGYRAEIIIDHVQKHLRNIEIVYSVEDSPLGTGGAVIKALKKTDSSKVFVLNGDSYLDCPLAKMFSNFRPPLTMACTHVNDANRFGRLDLNAEERILAFREKIPETFQKSGWINGGIYLFERTLFDRHFEQVFSLEKDFFPAILGEGIFGFPVHGLFIDIGTPESYAAAQSLLTPLVHS